MALFTPEQLKKNVVSGKVSEGKQQQNMVEYSKQANITKNNLITQQKVKDGYRKAREQGIVHDLPSYVKSLQSYGFEVEGWNDAIKNKAKKDAEIQKQQNVKNSPRYKNLLFGVRESIGAIPSAIQEYGLAGVSNTAEAIAKGLGREDIAQRFDTAQQQTQQQFEGMLDIGQNKESGWYQGGKMVGDLAQTFAGGALATGAMKGTKAMQVVNNIYNSGWKGKALVGGVASMAEQELYSGISEGRLSTKGELGTAGVVGAVIPLVPTIYRAFKGASPKVDDVVNVITQSKDKRQTKNLLDALSEFDFSKADDIKYTDIAQATDEKLMVMKNAVDEIAGKSAAPVNDLAIVTTKKGDSLITELGGEIPENAITRNYVKEGLDLLEGHYKEIGNNQMVLELKEIASKKVLTGKDVNRLAKIIPNDASLNTFANSGLPKTSKLAQSVEFLRKGLKTTMRKMSGDAGDVITELDGRMSNLITLKNQIDENIKGVQGLKNKIVPRSVGEKVGRFFGNVIDTLTLGGWKGFVTGSLKGNVGNKVLNRLDVEKNLAKNLKLLSKMDDFIEMGAKTNLDDLVKTISKETGYSVDEILAMGDDIKALNSIDNVAKVIDETPTPLATEATAQPVQKGLDDMLLEATDEELKSKGFTATMIKKLRKQQQSFNKVGTTENAIQEVSQQADEVLQTPTAMSKVEDTLSPTGKMDNTGKGLPKSESLGKIDDGLLAEARKYKSADEFVNGYKTQKVKLFEDSIEEIGDIQSIRHDLHSFDADSFYKSGGGDFGKYEEMLDEAMDRISSSKVLGNEKEYANKLQSIKNQIEDLDTDYEGYSEKVYMKVYKKGSELKEKANDIIEEYLNKIDEKYITEGLKGFSEEVERLRERTGSFAPSGWQRARNILGEGSENTAKVKTFEKVVDDNKLKQLREQAKTANRRLQKQD